MDSILPYIWAFIVGAVSYTHLSENGHFIGPQKRTFHYGQQ